MNVGATLVWGRLLILLVPLVLATLVAIAVAVILARRQRAAAAVQITAPVQPTASADHAECLRVTTRREVLGRLARHEIDVAEAERLLSSDGPPPLPSPAARPKPGGRGCGCGCLVAFLLVLLLLFLSLFAGPVFLRYTRVQRYHNAIERPETFP